MKSMTIVGLLLLVCGCAPTEPEPAAVPTTMPAPTTFQIDGSVKLNLTPQMSLASGLPATLNATLHADAHSEAISDNPMHSQHEGHLSLVITDGAGKQTFADIHLTVKGDSAGTPTEGLGDVIGRFLDAASLMSRPALPPTTATGR